MNVLADASLPGLSHAFPTPFHLTRYHHPDEIKRLLPDQDVLLCRANLKVNSTLLKNNNLRYVATASSGTDHLDHAWLESQNIGIIDAKGCNAQAVADYILACIAYLSQHNLLPGKKAGIIGLGKVGTQVATRLKRANYQIIQYDPLKATKEPATFQSDTLEDLYQADVLCIHAELHDTQPYPSTNLINQQFLAQLKPGCVLINAARGGLVHEEALLGTQHLIYCTDVYLNEPKIDKRIIDKALLCTPHIAGHSLEAKYRAVSMISDVLHQAMGLPLVQCTAPKKVPKPDLQHAQSWQETILALYNPIDETQQLKQALDKEQAFLNLRKNHCTRHDFALYLNSISNSQTRFMLDNILHHA